MRSKDLVDAAGIVRRHAGNLSRQYLEEALRPLCDLAEDMTAGAASGVAAHPS